MVKILHGAHITQIYFPSHQSLCHAAHVQQTVTKQHAHCQASVLSNPLTAVQQAPSMYSVRSMARLD